MERTSPAVRVEPTRCPYCHEAVRKGEVPAVCGACHALHHVDCLQEHGRCAACGGAAPRAEAAVPPARAIDCGRSPQAMGPTPKAWGAGGARSGATEGPSEHATGGAGAQPTRSTGERSRPTPESVDRGRAGPDPYALPRPRGGEELPVALWAIPVGVAVGGALGLAAAASLEVLTGSDVGPLQVALCCVVGAVVGGGWGSWLASNHDPE